MEAKPKPPHYDDIIEMRYLRRQLEDDFFKWLNLRNQHDVHVEMTKFLNYEANSDLTFYQDQWTDNHAEVLQKMRMLAGSHGHAVFKMLQIKKKHLQE